VEYDEVADLQAYFLENCTSLEVSELRELLVNIFVPRAPQRKSNPRLAADQDDQPAAACWETDGANDADLVMGAIGAITRRCGIAARCPLFMVGDPAPDYYLVQSGGFIVRRALARSGPRDARTAVRFVAPNELFIFDRAGAHVADCDAMVDSVVLRIDRQRFKQQAMLDPALGALRSAVHADELGWFLQTPVPGQRNGEEDQP